MMRKISLDARHGSRVRLSRRSCSIWHRVSGRPWRGSHAAKRQRATMMSCRTGGRKLQARIHRSPGAIIIVSRTRVPPPSHAFEVSIDANTTEGSENITLEELWCQRSTVGVTAGETASATLASGFLPVFVAPYLIPTHYSAIRI